MIIGGKRRNRGGIDIWASSEIISTIEGRKEEEDLRGHDLADSPTLRIAYFDTRRGCSPEPSSSSSMPIKITPPAVVRAAAYIDGRGRCTH